MSQEKELVLVFSIRDCLFSIDIKDLVEVVEVPQKLFNDHDCDQFRLGVMDVRGGAIPVMDIDSRMGFESSADRVGAIEIVLIVRTDKGIAGIPVDSIEGIIDVEERTSKFPGFMLQNEGLFSNVIDDEGRFIFMLGLNFLFNCDFFKGINEIQDN